MFNVRLGETITGMTGRLRDGGEVRRIGELVDIDDAGTAVVGAITDYSAAIRLDPKDRGSVASRGLAYYFKQDYDRAIADYTEAIRLDPADAATLYDRAIAHAAKRDFDRAIADYTEAIRSDPENARAYAGRGNSCAARQDYDRAIAVAERGGTKRPGSYCTNTTWRPSITKRLCDSSKEPSGRRRLGSRLN